MPANQKSNVTNAIVCELERFVPVAIPENLNQSRTLKADLEAYNIPVQLELREAEMDADLLGGVPVLVPEGSFEQASEIVSLIELSALEFDDFDDFEEEEEEEEEEEFEEEFEDDEDDEEYEDEEEEEEEEEDLEFEEEFGDDEDFEVFD
jgi:hypothetical protein